MQSSMFKAIYDALQDGLYSFDRDGRIIQINKAATNILGYSEEELIGQIGHDMFHLHAFNEERVNIQECPIYKAFLKCKDYVSEEYFRCKCGEVILVEVSASPMYKDEILTGCVVLFRDITIQKKYEKELKKKVKEEIQKRTENEYLYNKIFETANLGICLTNSEGRFVAVNPEYCKIYGYKEEELIGKHFSVVVPDEYKEALTKLHDKFLFEEKDELSNEWTVQRKNGELIHILSSASILKNIVAGPYKITTVSDITEAYIARELQQQQEAMLIQQSKMAAMGEMLGAIAHQWRQPLNVINCTTLDMKLQNDTGAMDNVTFSRNINELQSITQQMSQTINDFMHFFKMNKKISEVNIYNSIVKTLKIYQAQFNNSHINVEIEVDKTLHVLGIDTELQQIFLNLFSNSKDAFRKFKTDEKKICIKTRRTSEKKAQIIFQDNAGGIDESIISKIFDPYFTTHEKGIGIGLYMSALIMQNTFNGTMYAKNVYISSYREGVQVICEISYIEKNIKEL